MKIEINEKMQRKLTKLQAGHAWRLQLAEELLRQVGYTPSNQDNGDVVWTIPAHDKPLPPQRANINRWSPKHAKSGCEYTIYLDRRWRGQCRTS